MEVIIKLKEEEILSQYTEEAPLITRAKNMRWLVHSMLHLNKERDTLDLIIDGQRY